MHEPNLTDSAGQPWAGRTFSDNPHSDDTGEADPQLAAALEAFRNGDAGQADVVEAFRQARLLIPLLAELGDEGFTDAGKRVDKSQELSIVTVGGPDGRSVLPVFSSVATMSAWNQQARPVPAAGTRVALAAAREHTDLVALDPGSPTEFIVRRPAVWAIAQQEPWTPAAESDPVKAEFARTVAGERSVRSIVVISGDPTARLTGPEVIVRLTLQPGLDATQLRDLLARLTEQWSASELIAQRVDSLEVSLTAVPLIE
ncbi:MAG TPA: SseB family protein [Terrimesophilobacter sp.]|nr:SseB family protein [Terrimesophilobacter sp.]